MIAIDCGILSMVLVKEQTDEQNLHLVLALGGKEPCGSRHGCYDHEADDDAPPEYIVSIVDHS